MHRLSQNLRGMSSDQALFGGLFRPDIALREGRTGDTTGTRI